jgi:ATP-dependent RNA helicase DeaD
LVEQDGQAAGSVSRSQNVVYVLPHDWTSMSQFLGPMLDRVDDTSTSVQLLVLTADPEAAAAVMAASVRLIEGRSVGLLAATSSARAARLIRIKPAQVLAGTPDVIVDLLRAAALKLDSVKGICIAWTDELIAQGGGPALETLMAELPKDAARTIVAAELSAEIEALVERYARRARRVVSAANGTEQPIAVEYVTTSSHSRLAVLRRVLDALDPKSAVVFVRDENSNREVRDTLRSLGYSGNDATVRVERAAPPGTALSVLFDLPASREELREAASGAQRAIALVQPRQLTSLRALAAGGDVKPFTLPESGDRARAGEMKLREQIRDTLVNGNFARELLALEPLLDEYDGIEIAAAALQLLDRERSARAAVVGAATTPAPTPSGAMARLFVNVGSRDNIRPADLVGAITNQGGLSSSQIGKVDVRESHSLVEVDASTTASVIDRLTGSMIRGRRAVVRLDEGRAPRPARGAERHERVSARPRRGERE